MLIKRTDRTHITGDQPTVRGRPFPDVNSRSFVPGDSILFHRGQVWREELHLSSSGVSGRPIVYSAYGTGSNPHLTAGDPLTEWVSVGGNVWAARVTVVADPFNQLFLDGKRGTKVNKPCGIGMRRESGIGNPTLSSSIRTQILDLHIHCMVWRSQGEITEWLPTEAVPISSSMVSTSQKGTL